MSLTAATLSGFASRSAVAVQGFGMTATRVGFIVVALVGGAAKMPSAFVGRAQGSARAVIQAQDQDAHARLHCIHSHGDGARRDNRR